MSGCLGGIVVCGSVCWQGKSRGMTEGGEAGGDAEAEEVQAHEVQGEGVCV